MNAQGYMTILHSMADSALSDQPDLLLTISTSALQSAVQRVRGTPVVFTMVSNPFGAGVAESDPDHLANVTGAYGANDTEEMMLIIKQVMPRARRLGAMFAPTEINSVYSHDLLVASAKKAKFDWCRLV